MKSRKIKKCYFDYKRSNHSLIQKSDEENISDMLRILSEKQRF